MTALSPSQHPTGPLAPQLPYGGPGRVSVVLWAGAAGKGAPAFASARIVPDNDGPATHASADAVLPEVLSPELSLALETSSHAAAGRLLDGAVARIGALLEALAVAAGGRVEQGEPRAAAEVAVHDLYRAWCATAV